MLTPSKTVPHPPPDFSSRRENLTSVPTTTAENAYWMVRDARIRRARLGERVEHLCQLEHDLAEALGMAS